MAEKSDQGVEYCPCIERNAMARVNLEGFSRNVQARMNSVQPLIKLKSTVIANAGTERGIITRAKAVVTLQPSMSAASSNSFGIVSKYPFRFQMAKGRVEDPYAIINPNSVARNGSPLILKRESKTYSGASVAVEGSIMRTMNPNMPACRPMKRNREKDISSRRAKHYCQNACTQCH